MIDIITSALDEFIDNTSLYPVVRHAALRGLLMVNKYYGRTDESILYRIAMSIFINCLLLIYCSQFYLVLHPRYKSSYFLKAGWPRDWIDEAEKITREEWKANYQPTTNPGIPIANNSETSSAVSPLFFVFRYLQKEFNSVAIFGRQKIFRCSYRQISTYRCSGGMALFSRCQY
jgi:hypothetical protein